MAERQHKQSPNQILSVDSLRSEDLWRAILIDHAPEILVGCSEDDIVLEWNQEAERALGWSRQEAIGKVLGELILPESERPRWMRELALGREHCGPGSNRQLQINVARKSGKQFPADVFLIPVSHQGNCRFYTFVRDLTEIRQNERERAKILARERLARAEAEAQRAHLHQLFMEAPAVVNIFRGPDHTIELLHPLIARRLKREVTGMPFREAMPELAAQGLLAIFNRVYRTGKPYIGEADPALLHFDEVPQKTFWNLSVQPWRDPLGSIAGVMIFAVEVTEQVLARRNVEAALQSREEFILVASHELKTPLTSLKLQTQLAKRSLARGDPSIYKPERIRRMVENSERQLNRLTRLVEDMLEITQGVNGKLKLNRERLDLALIVKDVVDRFGPELLDAESEISLHAPESVEGDWDPHRIEQLVINLLSNAIKYGEHKPVSIEVRKEGETGVLIVADQGMGIDRSDHLRIFERYERAVDPAHISGFGLGLYFARQIVESHGGRIVVKSTRGRGATFRIELPISQPSRSRSDGSEQAGSKNQAARKAG